MIWNVGASCWKHLKLCASVQSVYVVLDLQDTSSYLVKLLTEGRWWNGKMMDFLFAQCSNCMFQRTAKEQDAPSSSSLALNNTRDRRLDYFALTPYEVAGCIIVLQRTANRKGDWTYWFNLHFRLLSLTPRGAHPLKAMSPVKRRPRHDRLLWKRSATHWGVMRKVSWLLANLRNARVPSGFEQSI